LPGAVGCSVSGLIAAGCCGLLCFWVLSVYYFSGFLAFLALVLPPPSSDFRPLL